MNNDIIYVVIDQRYCLESCEVTYHGFVEMLQQLGWDLNILRGRHRGVQIIADERGTVIAVEKGYENERW